ncbi:DUF2267 domain-containing protein [Bosea sp. CS1GBMeth4]|uniref:DUF2267 domain-containing protein n=1 Tax=Bosea sp. CS1GBMeth4 TaxID=1892849 RepID=UPI001649188F|nr:DUF2267 domain-containing protein [Bosea sp. CS1GBMeth4]
MTVPGDFLRASRDLERFLVDARDQLGHATTNQSWQSVLAVFVTFRARLSVAQTVAFAQALPAILGAMFLLGWRPGEAQKPFASRAELAKEAMAFRTDHSILPESGIADVAAALWRHVDRDAFRRMLDALPPEARAFWAVPDG